MFFVLINVFVVFERTVHALERIAMCKYLMHEVSECFRMENSWYTPFYNSPCMTARLLHFHRHNEPFLKNHTTFAPIFKPRPIQKRFVLLSFILEHACRLQCTHRVFKVWWLVAGSSSENGSRLSETARLLKNVRSVFFRKSHTQIDQEVELSREYSKRLLLTDAHAHPF